MNGLPGTGADNSQQAALLIDADNFHDVPAIEAAWAQLQARAGRVSVCRAYGNVVRLQTLAPVWRTLGARTFPNLSLEKNTTDAALIADAVALHFQQGVRFFAIASGDADFAPLAVRLREWGCQVWCFSMEGIVFQGVEAYYDRVVRFRPSACVAAQAMPAPVKPVMPAVPVRLAAAPVVLPVPEVVVVPAIPAKLREPIAATPTPVAMVAPGVENFSSVPRQVPGHSLHLPLPDEVQRILKAIPGLREGPQHLSQVVCVLRQQGILGKTTKSTTFLARHSAYFELSPAHQPTLILLRKSPAPSPPAPVAHSFDDKKPPVSVLATRSFEDARALQRIFAAFPAWLPDTVRQLSMMDTLLQEGGVQVGDKPLDKLFGAYPDYFKLLPDTDSPLKVRLLKKPKGLACAC